MQTRTGSKADWRILAVLIAAVATAPVRAKEDPWLRVQTPEFTVVTTLREKEAVAWVGEFAQYVAALRDFFHQPAGSQTPLTLVLFARESDFERYRPLNADGSVQKVAGFFSRQESWAVAGLSEGRNSEEMRRTIFHEGTHWFLSAFERRNPVWLEEGLAELFSTFTVKKGQAEWGRAIDSHIVLLNQMQPLPLERLLYAGQAELFHDDMHTSIVYAESWAFVHYLVFGRHQIPRKAMSDYVDALQTAIHPDEAFRQAFGISYREMDKNFQSYLGGGSYYVTRRPLAAVPAPVVKPALPREVSHALGQLAWATRRWPLAEKHAREEIRSAAELADGYELLGIALKQQGDVVAAEAAFTTAAEKGSREFFVYFELAQAEQRAAAEGGDLISAMAPGKARRIANRYERAINLLPRYEGSYEGLAGIINLAEPTGPADREFLDLGQRLFPKNQMIKLGVAIQAKKTGNDARARELLDAVLAAKGRPSAVVTFANQLDLAWEQQEIFDRVNALQGSGKFTEALAFVDDRTERGVHPQTRMQIKEMRRNLQANLRQQEIKSAYDESRWADARRLLGEHLADAAVPPFLKQQAQGSLKELDRMKLGLEGVSKP